MSYTNPSLNQSYLEATYPLILDLISPLILIHTSDQLNALLICLSSGPWFSDLAKAELWQGTEYSMDLDSAVGQQQLVDGIHVITEGTEILSRLRDNPDILQSCEIFRGQKSKALKVMATFAQCQRLDVWRRDAILCTLRDLEHGHTEANFLASEASDRLKIASLEALAVFSSNCPDIKWTIESALRCSESRYYYDATSQLYTPRWTCHECGKSEGNSAQTAESNILTGFLDPFKRLIPNCISPESRLALLQGLYCAFCHLDIANEDLKALDFGKFVLSQLFDSNNAVRSAAGEIAELIARMAGLSLVDDPLGKSSFDDCLERINEAIAKAFAKAQRANWPLNLCQRLMQHLPEDHTIYNSLLLKIIDQAFAESDVNRSGFILDELATIARDKGFSNYRLLQPQMEYVCAYVIEKLHAKNDRWLEFFYHWTGLTQTRFLQQNLPDLVPKMILLHSQSLIEKVAMTLNEKAGGLCIRQIDHILAAIYMQRNEENFQTCIELLRSLIVQIEPDSGKEMQSLGIAELTTLSTEGLLCCLSVELGHEEKSKRDKAKKVIEIVEGYAWERASQEHVGEGKVEEKPSLAVFMRRHILAIMSEVNTAILDPSKTVTLRTKVKYLRCLVSLVQMLDPIQRSVLSQIFSPLNIALSVHGLRLYTLLALNDIVRSVRPAQLDVLFSHLIHTLVKHYSKSNERERSIELEILKFLIFHQEEALIAVLPDAQGTFEQQLQRLIERSGNENAELAEQALVELRALLLANENQVLDMVTTKDKSVTPNLIQALLSGISRFRGLDAPVPRRCVECLGIIGAIDPAKLSTMRLIPAPPVHTDFNDLEEAKNFVCRLIELELVGKTRSIGDIRSESRWAYALQTLLSFCGITKGVLGVEKSTPSRSAFNTPSIKSAEDRWRAFPRHVQEVLKLLIDAKYTKAESSTQQEHGSPFYPHAGTFKEWLTVWTLVLIGKVTGRYAKDVFQACKHVVPYDTNTCLYILPHLVLDILIEGSEKDRREIVGEMIAVLRNTRDWKEDSADHKHGKPKQIFSELNHLGSQ
ncbi:serine/threonine-protein kinase M1, partial [Modicella reniformis]